MPLLEMYSALQGPNAPVRGCVQSLENRSAGRIPDHGAGGCGGRQRRSPVGGAANGIPLNAVMAGFVPDTPDTRPLSIRTGPLSAAGSGITAVSPARRLL